MITGVITARMAATRFPGKPLASIGNKSMLQIVIENSLNSSILDKVVVATCDEIILNESLKIGCESIMTSKSHVRATDRMFEVSTKIDSDVYVLIQADEPMISGEMINLAVDSLIKSNSLCVNLMTRIADFQELHDKNCIKVVFDKNYDALYFSRSIIPSDYREINNFFKQVCVIPMTKSTLQVFHNLPESRLEKLESIDMLRLLENGINVKMVQNEQYTHSVDTKEDIDLVKKLTLGK